MPIKVPDNLPALETLNAEQVDVMPQEMAVRQDIRPLKLLLLNLMPKKRDTEIQFARLFGNTPLQVEMILMTTASYTPRNTERMDTALAQNCEIGNGGRVGPHGWIHRWCH